MLFSNYELTKKFEGCKLKAYQCSAGVWTIGYGHTRGVTEGMVITQAQANACLVADMKQCEKVVDSAVRVPLNQNQYDALCDFVFNLGAGSLNKSTLLKCLNAGQYAKAAQEFLKWDYAGGKVLAGLTKRRKAEKELFETI